MDQRFQAPLGHHLPRKSHHEGLVSKGVNVGSNTSKPANEVMANALAWGRRGTGCGWEGVLGHRLIIILW